MFHHDYSYIAFTLTSTKPSFSRIRKNQSILINTSSCLSISFSVEGHWETAPLYINFRNYLKIRFEILRKIHKKLNDKQVKSLVLRVCCANCFKVNVHVIFAKLLHVFRKPKNCVHEHTC